MGDNPLDMIENVGLNFVTGGLYSIGKAALSDDPIKALSVQGLDVGLASTLNQSLVDTFGDEAGMIFNALGGAAGAVGAAGGFAAVGAPGFVEGGVAPLAAGAEAATPSGVAALAEGAPVTATGTATPLAPGTMGSTTAADLAATELTGPVGLTAAPTVSAPAASSVAAPTGTGMINATSLAPETAGYTNAVSTAEALQAAQTAPTIASLSDPVKMALVLAGGQMLTGSMGGLFTGLSAQKKLELETLINEQNQTQRQYLNKNNSYAPKLSFKQPTGMIHAGKD